MSENEKLVERLLGFDKAYPPDIFPEPGTAERAWLAHHRPGLQDRVAASMGRHFAKHAREAAAALSAAEARIKALSEALDALIIESGGSSIPNTNLTICRTQALSTLGGNADDR